MSSKSLGYSKGPEGTYRERKKRRNRVPSQCLVQPNMEDSLAAGVAIGTRLGEGGAT